MSRGFGIAKFGEFPYGTQTPEVISTFGIAAIQIIHGVPKYGHIIRVTFTMPLFMNQSVYETSNYQITIRFGRAHPIFIKQVIPNNEIAPISVDLVLHNSVQVRGQYRLTVQNVKSTDGQSIEGS